MDEKLFVSFVLDRENGLEIALPAGNVFEATGVNNQIRPLPSSQGFVEGLMQLRDDVIPIVNLKRRLGIAPAEYDNEAKIAVVKVLEQRCGLLFDDIRDVFRISPAAISPVNTALQSDDRIISDLIKLDGANRVLELLDLDYLFLGDDSGVVAEGAVAGADEEIGQKSYSRFLVFGCAGQEYGVSVDFTQEISFFREIDEMYRNGIVEGALQIRGHTIPVIDAGALLVGSRSETAADEERRIIILTADDISFGLIVDEVREIINIADDIILPMPANGKVGAAGVYNHPGGGNVMLLDIDGLVSSQTTQLKSIARIKKDVAEDETVADNISHNIITENCYLIVSIGKKFALELSDVQEIIEYEGILSLPAATGFHRGVINLRGLVVPVVNLREFYGYPEIPLDPALKKLIICRGKSRTVALEVDSIVTIFKREQFYTTPSIKRQFSARKDTLDRLIEYIDSDDGLQEHVLVINVYNLIQNHLYIPLEEDEDSNSSGSNNNNKNNEEVK